jgi:hypothetical protein
MLSSEELGILGTLDALVRKKSVQQVIDAIVSRLQTKLAAEPKEALAREPVALAVFGKKLPRMIRSCWVFILRSGTSSGGERHPNSHQRTMSYRGKGDFQVHVEDEWHGNLLVSDFQGPLQSRWVSIPTDVWHQAVVGDEDWVVVSFHTASDVELILERPDSAQTEPTSDLF